jgi:predicted phosphodiesterase
MCGTYVWVHPVSRFLLVVTVAAVRIGLLADIHEDYPRLSNALVLLSSQGVDQIVVLGDTLTTVRHPDAIRVIQLLRDAEAIGVWGNHDFGLCKEVHPELRDSVNPEILAYMAGMQPHLEIGECHFSHVEPWLDPWDVSGLWYYDGPPDTPEKVGRSFAAVPHRFLFLGHFHQWLLMTRDRRCSWAGEEPARLADFERCLVVVGPVCRGDCAVFDTTSMELLPLRC